MGACKWALHAWFVTLTSLPRRRERSATLSYRRGMHKCLFAAFPSPLIENSKLREPGGWVTTWCGLHRGQCAANAAAPVTARHDCRRAAHRRRRVRSVSLAARCSFGRGSRGPVILPCVSDGRTIWCRPWNVIITAERRRSIGRCLTLFDLTRLGSDLCAARRSKPQSRHHRYGCHHDDVTGVTAVVSQVSQCHQGGVGLRTAGLSYGRPCQSCIGGCI